LSERLREFILATNRRTWPRRRRIGQVKTKVLTHLGIYTEEGFLNRASCESLKAQMRAGREERALVYEGGADYVLNESRRSTVKVNVSDSAASFVRDKLLAKCEEFTRRFDVEVNDCQEPTFLAYKSGDFFEPHRDLTQNENAPDKIRRRRISVVVFLGDESGGETEGEYKGGALAFYGLLDDPRCQNIAIPVQGRAGMLVAFRSEVLHQVFPVIEGERFTIVTWFF